MVLWKKLWHFTENYGTLIYYGKNYGTIVNYRIFLLGLRDRRGFQFWGAHFATRVIYPLTFNEYIHWVKKAVSQKRKPAGNHQETQNKEYNLSCYSRQINLTWKFNYRQNLANFSTPTVPFFLYMFQLTRAESSNKLF